MAIPADGNSLLINFPRSPRNLDRRTTITIDEKTFEVDADDLEKLCDLGRGAYGVVEKMRHRQTNTEMAVKRITHTVNSQEQKRLLMDLDISMRASACPYTVHFYGALFREGDVWICMEVMDTSLDKFYPKVFKNKRIISEDILGKVGGNKVSVCSSLISSSQPLPDCVRRGECPAVPAPRTEGDPQGREAVQYINQSKGRGENV